LVLTVTGLAFNRGVDNLTREALNRIAAGQHGLFSVRQGNAIGASHAQLLRAASSGKLRRVRRGVYAIAGAPSSPWGPIIAAALLGGRDSVISHQSAAAIHQFEFATLEPVELTLPRNGSSRLPGVIVHRSSDLSAVDIATIRGLSVTSPCRTLVDLASRLGPVLTEKTLDEGLIQRRWTAIELLACLNRARANIPGRAQLEKLLLLRAEEPGADSQLEVRAFRAIAPLAPYATHFSVPVGSCVYVLDVAWPDQMVAAEIVGRSHRVASRSAFDRERRKLNALAGAGWRVAHLTAAMSEAEMVGAVQALLPGASAAPGGLPMAGAREEQSARLVRY